MRFSQFKENQALADAAKVIEKNFSPERAAIKDKVVALIRDIQMGKGDKMQQAMELTALTKSELEAKRMDPDLTVGVDLNVGMMKRAMAALTNANESITEEELEEYKSISSLRNDQMFRALAKLQDKKAEKDSPVKKIELPKQLDLFKVGESLTEAEFDEAAGEKDACYHKVKSRYKVWPSAYASGALVQCRKVGAANWGNKSKK